MLDHNADIGIKVLGKDIGEVFSNSAYTFSLYDNWIWRISRGSEYIFCTYLILKGVR